MGHQASDDPSAPPPPAAPSPPPSPSFLSSSFFSASAFSLLFAAGLASLELAGLASLLAGFASPAEPAFALADAGYYADAYMAACIYASSSSIPFSKRKFAAISSFLSQAKKASAARAFEKPSPTKRSIDAISSGVT